MATEKEFDVAIVRIIGNELPPRHVVGSNAEQLHFILANEAIHPRVKKIWLLNRLVDKEDEARLVKILQDHQCEYTIIPFDIARYKKFLTRFDGRKTFFWFRRRGREVIAKAGFIIDINGARNKAIEIGAKYADWVVPLDGGCCLTTESMALMLEKVVNPQRNVYALPTYRLVNNTNYIGFAPQNYPMHESMLLLKSTFQKLFDENISYGMQDKLKTIFQLFPRQAIRKTSFAHLVDDPQYHAGYVVRLSSGNQIAEGKYRKRVSLRMEGLKRLVEKIDSLV